MRGDTYLRMLIIIPYRRIAAIRYSVIKAPNPIYYYYLFIYLSDYHPLSPMEGEGQGEGQGEGHPQQP